MDCLHKIVLYIFFLSLSSIVMSQPSSFSDGPMTLKVRVTFVYIDDYYDATQGQEPRWKAWVSDDAGSNWSGGNCIQGNECFAQYWVNLPGNSCGNPSPYNITIFDNPYSGATVPSRFKLRIEGWEDDYPTFWPCSGSNCSYDTGGCDNDDQHSGTNNKVYVCLPPTSSPGESLVGSEVEYIYYRDMGPPCQWNGSSGTSYTGYEYLTSNGSFGLQINTYWQMTASTSGTFVWNGLMSNDWFEPCNWNTSSVPTISKNVYIPASATNQPIVYAAANSSYTTTGQAYCNTIEIETGADLEIQTTSGASLEIQQ